jgi:hypothetical protein
MQIPILIEPLATGGFRARSGEPLVACAEGATEDEAVRQLRIIIHQRLQNGSRLSVLEFNTPAATKGPPRFEPLPDDAAYLQALQEVMAANRQIEE